jgi:adenylosuccinate synthase
MDKKNVSILVGMAGGSEAKGKLIAIIANTFDIHVRTGSINAAHTTYYQGKGYPWHLIPCGALLAPNAALVMGAGAQLDEKIMLREIGWLKDNNMWLLPDGTPRLKIDPHATVIEPIDVFAENGWADVCGPEWYAPTTCAVHEGDKNHEGVAKVAKTCEGCAKYPAESLHKALGSTTHGSGFNLIRKLARKDADGIHCGMLRDNKGNKLPICKTAADVEAFKPFLCDTVTYLNEANDAGKKILIEGTQGSILSVHHGYWPTTTSRDTNASNWAMEAGISPMAVEKVYGVTRTFPIRVFGNSGPFGGAEITWEEVSKYYYGLPPDMSDADLTKWLADNGKELLCEITTATKRRRRVFAFSEYDFKRAVMLNRPGEMMLSFVDYLNANDFGKSKWEDLSQTSRDWITTLESKLGVHFKYLSTGPDNHQTIIREAAPVAKGRVHIENLGTHADAVSA